MHMPRLTKGLGVGLGGGILAIMILVLFIFYPHPSKHYHMHNVMAVIKPTFTIAAYQPRGFYDYYRKQCEEECLTVTLDPKSETSIMSYAGSNNGLNAILSNASVDVLTDEQVSNDPSILEEYQRVIVLHNEYVTQAEFDAITNHPNVFYLYPNSLYALVSYNTTNQTITLEEGHGYNGVNNAFGWGPSMTTKNEYNTKCNNWQLDDVENGVMLNCYPENRILEDADMVYETER